MIPYSDCILIVVVWLSARHYYVPGTSARAKRLVLYIVGASILAGFLMPSILRLSAALVQIAVCFFLVCYQTASTADSEHARPTVPPSSDKW